MNNTKTKVLHALALAFFCAILLAPTAQARVQVLEPVYTATDGAGLIDLGVVGPGQTLEIIVSNDTAQISRGNKTDSQQNADWDVLQVVKEALPNNWIGEDSPRYENPLKARVIVSKDAPDGEYEFSFKAIDEFEEVTAESFSARARVTRDVLETTLLSEPVKTEPKTTAEYVVEIKNKGSASDVFQVKLESNTQAIKAERTLLVRHNSVATVKFNFETPERGEYPLTFTITSQSSPNISNRIQTSLFVGSNLVSDLKAAARGLLLFPTSQSAVYAILALIGNALG